MNLIIRKGTLDLFAAIIELLKAALGMAILVLAMYLVSFSNFNLREPSWFSVYCGLVISFGYLFSFWEGIANYQSFQTWFDSWYCLFFSSSHILVWSMTRFRKTFSSREAVARAFRKCDEQMVSLFYSIYVFLKQFLIQLHSETESSSVTDSLFFGTFHDRNFDQPFNIMLICKC